jgi:hypothetical protein
METTRIVRRPGGRGNSSEATRIARQPCPDGNTVDATRIILRPDFRRKAASALPDPPRKVPAVKAPAAKTPPALLPLARFALVALVLGKERAAELLEGLGEREAERAKEHLACFAALSSAQRQAKVAAEFGTRSDPVEQLRGLMAEAPEALRREIFRKLPPYYRSLFPEPGRGFTESSTPPALCALAERLIREATR